MKASQIVLLIGACVFCFFLLKAGCDHAASVEERKQNEKKWDGSESQGRYIAYQQAMKEGDRGATTGMGFSFTIIFTFVAYVIARKSEQGR